MSPIEEGSLSGPKVTAVGGDDDVDLDREFGLGVGQVFFEEEGSIVIDLDKHLCCIS